MNFKNIPERILALMPGYQSFKKKGIQYDKINALIDKNKIVYFDFIIPMNVFQSIILTLKLNKNKITTINAREYESCFNLNKSDGDIKTQPYFNEVKDILRKINIL